MWMYHNLFTNSPLMIIKSISKFSFFNGIINTFASTFYSFYNTLYTEKNHLNVFVCSSTLSGPDSNVSSQRWEICLPGSLLQKSASHVRGGSIKTVMSE